MRVCWKRRDICSAVCESRLSGWRWRAYTRHAGMEKLSLDEDARATVGSPVATGGSPRASPPRPQLEDIRPDGVERVVAGASGRRRPARRPRGEGETDSARVAAVADVSRRASPRRSFPFHHSPTPLSLPLPFALALAHSLSIIHTQARERALSHRLSAAPHCARSLAHCLPTSRRCTSRRRVCMHTAPHVADDRRAHTGDPAPSCSTHSVTVAARRLVHVTFRSRAPKAHAHTTPRRRREHIFRARRTGHHATTPRRTRPPSRSPDPRPFPRAPQLTLGAHAAQPVPSRRL